MLAELWWRVTDLHLDDHLLEQEGEVEIDRVRHHWAGYWFPAAEIVVALGLCVVFVLEGVQPDWLPLLLLPHAGWRALHEYMDCFVITNFRVIRIWGVFSKRRATVPIGRILDISVEKPFVGRLAGYGHFVFESAAQVQGLRDIRYVGKVDRRDKVILTAVQHSNARGSRPV